MIDQPIYHRKYRAWNKALRKMEYDFSVTKNAQYLCDYILMMSTTLFDCNGKEIYEGDIIEQLQSKPLKGYVKFGVYQSEGLSNEGVGFYFHREDGCIFSLYTDIAPKKYKVVGNIKEEEFFQMPCSL